MKILRQENKLPLIEVDCIDPNSLGLFARGTILYVRGDGFFCVLDGAAVRIGEAPKKTLEEERWEVISGALHALLHHVASTSDSEPIAKALDALVALRERDGT